jgi:hypothetical protein
MAVHWAGRWADAMAEKKVAVSVCWKAVPRAAATGVERAEQWVVWTACGWAAGWVALTVGSTVGSLARLTADWLVD